MSPQLEADQPGDLRPDPIPGEPTDDELANEDGEPGDDGAPGYATERIEVDTPADLDVEDPTLEQTEGDEDLGEE